MEGRIILRRTEKIRQDEKVGGNRDLKEKCKEKKKHSKRDGGEINNLIERDEGKNKGGSQ